MPTDPQAMTVDPRRAKQFYRKHEAVVAARSIGWRAKDATEITVMGFRLYTIADDHGRMLTPAAFESLLSERTIA